MACALHIERQLDAITLEEWIAAVEKIKDLRLAEGDSRITNSKTGEVISVPSNAGDISVLFRIKGFLGLGVKSEWRDLYSLFSRQG